MNQLDDLIKKYTVKHDHFIRKLCSPLMDKLNIPFFSYYSIRRNGQFSAIGNYPGQLEYFYSEKLYISCPFLSDPRHFRSGYAFIETTTNKNHREIILNRFEMNHLVLKLERSGDFVEGFIFLEKNMVNLNYQKYFSNLDLLNKFARYFKREAKHLIDSMNEEGYNLLLEKGSPFFEKNDSISLSSENSSVTNFLKTILPLTPREQQCFELFRMGKSAQATASILNLSNRTVENYFENIKSKLGCHSKWDLLEW